LAKARHKRDIDPNRARELAEWRERAGLTQAEASKRLGVLGLNTLSRWETGQRAPDSDDYRRAMALYRAIVSGGHAGNVPRGTHGPPESPRRPLAAILTGQRATEWLAAFHRELRSLGAHGADADRAVGIVTNEANLSLFVQPSESVESGFIETEVLDGMEALAGVVRDRIRGRQSSRDPDDTSPNAPTAPNAPREPFRPRAATGESA
jgi:transcriptional regulator with XRE-family HTH domain